MKIDVKLQYQQNINHTSRHRNTQKSTDPTPGFHRSTARRFVAAARTSRSSRARWRREALGSCWWEGTPCADSRLGGGWGLGIDDD